MVENIYLDTRLVWLPESGKLNLERLDLRLQSFKFSFCTVRFKVSTGNFVLIISPEAGWGWYRLYTIEHLSMVKKHLRMDAAP